MDTKQKLLEKIVQNEGKLWLKSHTNKDRVDLGTAFTSLEMGSVIALASMTNENVLEKDVEVSGVLQSFC